MHVCVFVPNLTFRVRIDGRITPNIAAECKINRPLIKTAYPIYYTIYEYIYNIPPNYVSELLVSSLFDQILSSIHFLSISFFSHRISPPSPPPPPFFDAVLPSGITFVCNLLRPVPRPLSSSAGMKSTSD